MLIWLLWCLCCTLSHPLFLFLTDSDLLLTPNETNIVANENEKAVLPCQPTSSEVNMTLYKGEFSWSTKRVSATMYAELNSLRQLDCMYSILMAKKFFKFCFYSWFGCSVYINCAKLIKVHTLNNIICAVIKHFNNRMEFLQDKCSVLERNSKHRDNWWLVCWKMTVVLAVIRFLQFFWIDGKIAPASCSNKIRQEEIYNVRQIIIVFHTSSDTDKTILKVILYEGILDWLQLVVDGVLCRVLCLRVGNIFTTF